MSSASKNALVLITKGSEEMEAVISIDVLRRGGVQVTVACVFDEESGAVECSRDVKIVPDCKLSDVKDKLFDAIVLPGGGPGAQTFGSSADVGSMLKNHMDSGKLVAAICASPTALQSHNIAKGRFITSYPLFKNKLESEYKYLDDDVVVDGNLVTSRGPGTSFMFGIKLVEILAGKDAAEPLAGQMIL